MSNRDDFNEATFDAAFVEVAAAASTLDGSAMVAAAILASAFWAYQAAHPDTAPSVDKSDVVDTYRAILRDIKGE